MEKSIESIWKEGFLDKNAMIAPKLNNLYTQKSIHIVDTFKRRFRINLTALFIFSIIFLVVSFLIELPLMGVVLFLLFNIVVLVNKKLLKSLEKVDKNMSSYEYLHSFNTWIHEQISINIKMSRFIYPFIFIGMVTSFWFSNPFRETLHRVLGNYQPYMAYGIPIYWVLTSVIIISLLAVFGGRIYRWDLNIVYGSLFKKLEELLADMEDLRAEPSNTNKG